MDAKSEALDNTRRLYDDVREAVEPLLHDFLTHPMNGKFVSFITLPFILFENQDATNAFTEQ